MNLVQNKLYLLCTICVLVVLAKPKLFELTLWEWFVKRTHPLVLLLLRFKGEERKKIRVVSSKWGLISWDWDTYLKFNLFNIWPFKFNLNATIDKSSYNIKKIFLVILSGKNYLFRDYFYFFEDLFFIFKRKCNFLNISLKIKLISSMG